MLVQTYTSAFVQRTPEQFSDLQLSLDLKWLYLLHISWKLNENEKGFYDNLDQQDEVLTSAGINWQTFCNVFTLNIVSILLLT